MKINNGDLPAMPVDMTNEKLAQMMQEATISATAKSAVRAMLGLSKREMFAMAAMQGLLVNAGRNGYEVDTVQKQAVICADMLLAELERTK